MKVVLEIDDSKGKSLLEFLKSLDFVRIEENVDLPHGHQKIIDERLEFLKSFPEQKSNLDDVLNTIESEI